MGFKINKVKTDLASYPPYLFLAPRKFGKTTWWRNLVPKAWGSSEKGLLISFGNEEGYHALDNLQVEVAREWDAEYDEETDMRGFVQIVDDIIENNDEYGLKGVCFDTLDTFISVATDEVLRQHRVEKGTVCKSLNDAFSGYGRGTERLFKIADAQIQRLRDAGLAVFFLCHIKNKERTDMVSGDKFEMITNNLSDNIFTHFADTAQMVMVGVLDREINDGKILSEERVIHLRGTSQIDAGGRFTHIVDTIDLDPNSFLTAFKDAVKAEMGENVTDEDIEKIASAEQKKMKSKAEIAKSKEAEKKSDAYVDGERNTELLKEIKESLTTASDVKTIQKKIKEYLVNNGYESLKVDLPTKALEEVAEIAKG